MYICNEEETMDRLLEDPQDYKDSLLHGTVIGGMAINGLTKKDMYGPKTEAEAKMEARAKMEAIMEAEYGMNISLFQGLDG